MSDGIVRSAKFSKCRTWRYTLERVWDSELPRLLFVLLNPSTADAEKDDPTNRRGIGFAKRWGFGSVIFVNLFSVRSPDPQIIKDSVDPVGPENDFHIIDQACQADMVVCAWGVHGDQFGRIEEVLPLLRSPVFHLGLTKHGHPRHPLYLKNETKPEIWQ